MLVTNALMHPSALVTITDSCNIQEEEILAEKLQKYPCLIDKSDKWYKKSQKINAWKAVMN